MPSFSHDPLPQSYLSVLHEQIRSQEIKRAGLQTLYKGTDVFLDQAGIPAAPSGKITYSTAMK